MYKDNKYYNKLDYGNKLAGALYKCVPQNWLLLAISVLHILEGMTVLILSLYG